MISEENKQYFQNEKYLFQTEAFSLRNEEIDVNKAKAEHAAENQYDKGTDIIGDALGEEWKQEIPYPIYGKSVNTVIVDLIKVTCYSTGSTA